MFFCEGDIDSNTSQHIAGKQQFKHFLYKTLLLHAITPADCHLLQQSPQNAAFDLASMGNLASSSAYF